MKLIFMRKAGKSCYISSLRQTVLTLVLLSVCFSITSLSFINHPRWPSSLSKSPHISHKPARASLEVLFVQLWRTWGCGFQVRGLPSPILSPEVVDRSGVMDVSLPLPFFFFFPQSVTVSFPSLSTQRWKQGGSQQPIKLFQTFFSPYHPSISSSWHQTIALFPLSRQGQKCCGFSEQDVCN